MLYNVLRKKSSMNYIMGYHLLTLNGLNKITKNSYISNDSLIDLLYYMDLIKI